jgi:hypothetical protein
MNMASRTKIAFSVVITAAVFRSPSVVADAEANGSSKKSAYPGTYQAPHRTAHQRAQMKPQRIAVSLYRACASRRPSAMCRLLENSDELPVCLRAPSTGRRRGGDYPRSPVEFQLRRR